MAKQSSRTLRLAQDDSLRERLRRSRPAWVNTGDDPFRALRAALGVPGMIAATIPTLWPTLGWRGPQPFSAAANRALLRDPRWRGLTSEEKSRQIEAAVYALGHRYFLRDIAEGKRKESVLKLEHAAPLRALLHEFIASEVRVYLRDSLLRDGTKHDVSLDETIMDDYAYDEEASTPEGNQRALLARFNDALLVNVYDLLYSRKARTIRGAAKILGVDPKTIRRHIAAAAREASSSQ